MARFASGSSVRARAAAGIAASWSPGALTVCGCETLDLALARMSEWNTEIEVARADGWR